MQEAEAGDELKTEGQAKQNLYAGCRAHGCAWAFWSL